MGLSVHSAVAIARAIDRQRKHERWVSDMKSNIYRWECSLEKLENITTNANANIRKNEAALVKAQGFYELLTSGKSQAWYERACINRDKYDDLNAKVVAHENKVSSTSSRIQRLREWIQNDENKISDIKRKIDDIKDKIYDVESKLR